MSSITAVARQFFEACEAGRGWEVCRAYCTPDASFVAQSEPLADVRTLQAYCDWMKGLLTFMPDGRYVVKSFATDEERRNVAAYGVFSATHSGEGGPCPPTGKSTTTDYVYVMDFDGDKIPAHDENLERRMGHEGARPGLTHGFWDGYRKGLSIQDTVIDRIFHVRRRTPLRQTQPNSRPHCWRPGAAKGVGRRATASTAATSELT